MGLCDISNPECHDLRIPANQDAFSAKFGGYSVFLDTVYVNYLNKLHKIKNLKINFIKLERYYI